MKSSVYNHFLELDDEIFGYNFLSQNTIRMSRAEYILIQDYLSKLGGDTSHSLGSTSSPWPKILKDARFVVASDFDELKFLKVKYNQSLFANDQLRLIILPTLACNFDCPYCFEFKKNITMDETIRKALIKWVEKRFNKKRNISVCWYGGEPLLAKNLIMELTEKLQSFCKRIGADYGAELTTNGYYLDNKFIERLATLKINHVHITLDGDEISHDRLRRSNGSATFSKILNNITQLCKNDNDCKLTLRINCCDDNYSTITSMLKTFPKVIKNKAVIYFRWIESYEANNYRKFSCENKGENEYLGLGKLYAESYKLGWKTNNPLEYFQYSFCEVDFIDHYNIDPFGNVFFCSKSFNKNESIGTIKSGDLKLNNSSDYFGWYDASPFDDIKCLKCKILPVCFGGCRKFRTINTPTCPAEHISLDLFVKNIIYRNK